MKRTALTLGVLVALSFFALPALAGDLIKLKNGQWHIVKAASDPPTTDDHDASTLTVLEENYDKTAFSIKIGDKTTRQEVDTSQVDTVYYEPKPDAWLQAIADYNGGDFRSAVEEFSALASNSSNRFWIRLYSLYYIGMIYSRSYEWAPAVTAWEKLMSEFPKSRFVPEALVQIGLAAINLDNSDKARDAFSRLSKLPGLADAQKMKARYYLILIKQKQGERTKNNGLITEALNEYRALLSEVEKDPALKDVATLARLGIGTCLILLAKYDEALSFFRNVADSTEDRSVLAGVFNGLGMCLFKTEKWKDALLAFLRTEVLYNDDPDQLAMALFYSGKCFEFMQGAGIGSDNATRARAQYRKCISRFGGTAYGKAAAEALPNVRGK